MIMIMIRKRSTKAIKQFNSSVAYFPLTAHPEVFDLSFIFHSLCVCVSLFLWSCLWCGFTVIIHRLSDWLIITWLIINLTSAYTRSPAHYISPALQPKLRPLTLEYLWDMLTACCPSGSIPSDSCQCVTRQCVRLPGPATLHSQTQFLFSCSFSAFRCAPDSDEWITG